jgi:hypothetical protein
MTFAQEFDLIPYVLERKEILAIYYSLTKSKEMIDKIPVGLTIDEFRQALLRMSIKGKKFFEGIVSSPSQRAEEEDIQLQLRNKSPEEEPKKDQQMEPSLLISQGDPQKAGAGVGQSLVTMPPDDNYAMIDEASSSALEGLLLFLDVPPDRQGQINRTKPLRPENSKHLPDRMKREGIILAPLLQRVH